MTDSVAVRKVTPLHRIGVVSKFLVLMLHLVVTLFPFLWIVITSLKGSQAEIYAFPVTYFPEDFSFINYINIFKLGNFGTYFLNSFLYASLAALGGLFVATLAGYVLAVHSFRLKSAVLFFFLFTQMIPGIMMLAPQYRLMANLGLVNTPYVLLVLYTAAVIPFSVVTMKAFFGGFPIEIQEAAAIDGAKRLRIVFTIALPLMLPGIVSTLIFNFINMWNELFAAIMFIDVDRYKTIPVALNALILKYDIKWGEMMAGTVISIIPTIFLFVLTRRYMLSGLTSGAVKG